MKLLVIGVLLGIFAVQQAALWNYRRQVKDICRQLAFLMEQESNMKITSEINGGGIGELTELLNGWVDRSRREKLEYRKKEKRIAETYTSLSHDIRTPLTSLDGYVQLLKESQDQEEQKKYLGIMEERIRSLKELLEELFTFAKLKNEDFHLELSSCDVNKILKSIIFSYYDEWSSRGIEPRLCLPEEPLYIEGNEQAIRRTLQNILKNVLDHGNNSICIFLFAQGEHLVLQVKNQVAHPEEIDVDQVFERFFKGDPARSKTSSGLGLSIARELVQRMKGEIQAGVEDGNFCIELRFPLCVLSGL
ncbi:MAG: HAMP domain-containing sensor histidine kinase [Eubacteriales bacterium]|nr:HAMP domain-containing sensor histidine kinase [Eubacteriales bacterium]